MTSRDDHPLYVGYRRLAPRAVTRFVRPRVALVAAIGLATAALLALSQERFEPGVFEYGRPRSFEGTVAETPYPLLQVRPPAAPADGSADSLYYLVAFGKHGAAREMAGFDGRSVRLRGTLIHRDQQSMIEVETGSVETLAADAPSPEAPRADLGVQTLVGEIVDSKCYLGVMKPGRERPHRACAALCIRGGIPPVLVATAAGGGRRHLLLVDERGRPVNERVLDLVAEPVEITGRVVRQGNLFYLMADPAGYRRVAGS